MRLDSDRWAELLRDYDLSVLYSGAAPQSPLAVAGLKFIRVTDVTEIKISGVAKQSTAVLCTICGRWEWDVREYDHG